jgi:hypothetical protein
MMRCERERARDQVHAQHRVRVEREAHAQHLQPEATVAPAVAAAAQPHAGVGEVAEEQRQDDRLQEERHRRGEHRIVQDGISLDVTPHGADAPGDAAEDQAEGEQGKGE